MFLAAYAQTCAGVVGVPAVTIPGVAASTTATTQSISIGLPSSTTPIVRSTVTVGTAPPIVVQSTITGAGSSTTDDTLPSATNGIPGVVANDGTQSYNAKQAGLVAISAMLGAALVL